MQDIVHLFKKLAVRDYVAAAKAIPIIDYGPYFAGKTQALERIACEVAHASENVVIAADFKSGSDQPKLIRNRP
jgi:hypothetical protein